MARERILLTLTPGLLARVDAARGEEPRVRWIERAVERALGVADGRAVSVPSPRRSDRPEEDRATRPAPAEPLSALDLERRRREAFAKAANHPPKRS